MCAGAGASATGLKGLRCCVSRRGKFLREIKSVNVMSPRSHLNDSKPPQCNCHRLSERWPRGSVPNTQEGENTLSPSSVQAEAQASWIPGKGLLRAMETILPLAAFFLPLPSKAVKGPGANPARQPQERLRAVLQDKGNSSGESGNHSCPQALSGGPGG